MSRQHNLLSRPALLLILLGSLCLPVSLVTTNVKNLLLTPERTSNYINEMLDRPEELGRFVHRVAVQKVISYQESSSFADVPKHFLLLSFLDPDEFEPAIRMLINRKQLTQDVEQTVNQLNQLAGSDDRFKLMINPAAYIDHIKNQLPEILEFVQNRAPRCNEQQLQWYRDHTVPPFSKQMPKCLPGDPTRSRIKSYLQQIALEKLSQVPEQVDVGLMLQDKTGVHPEMIKQKLRSMNLTLMLMLGCPVLFILIGAHFRGDDFQNRLQVLANCLLLAGGCGFLFYFLILGLPFSIYFPLILLLNQASFALIVQSTGLLTTGFLIRFIPRIRRSHAE